MDISSATTIPTQLNQRVSETNNQQPVRKVEREREQNNPQQQTVQREERLDVNEQALALVEQEYGQQNSNTNQQADNQPVADFDNPSQQNKTAVAAYQSVDNQEKKESVQQLFGVDLYA